MSLYFDAVSVLTNPPSIGGSFKSRIYSSRNLKANPAQIYALITEASKWDILLKEVIENAGILGLEPKLTPLLALLLVHDHLLSKNGIAAPVNHPIRQAVDRHKSRLKAEFAKARVRRGCASVDELKAFVSREKTGLGSHTLSSAVYPRWVRVNNVRSSLDAQLRFTFSSYRKTRSLSDLDSEEPRLYIDPNIPDLLAVSPSVDLTACPAYKNGEIILQDKASCFPAYLLANSESGWEGDLVDACAAPGNKTTHLASLLSRQAPLNSKNKKPRRYCIFSMDASPARSKTLQKMVSSAGADDIVTVLAGQDFLAINPDDARFANVSGLLLDPSCSGSGIIGRDDVPQLTLPAAPQRGKSRGKKRKRKNDDGQEIVPPTSNISPTEGNETSERKIDLDRLSKLSSIQTRIIEHALCFPAATRVTYSTCSIHAIENESVVSRALASDAAKRRGWRIMRRDEQPEGLKMWKHRGAREEDSDKTSSLESSDAAPVNLSDEELDACLRCWPGDEEGLGGFFVAGFIRDDHANGLETNEEEEDEWKGFSD